MELEILRALCFLMYDQVQGLTLMGNDDIHRRVTRGRARFNHEGDVDGENPST
jgi:hypothetical protein